MKLIGSFFVIGSMTGFGIWKAEEVKRSYQALVKLQNLIGSMQSELAYAGSDFGEIFGQLAKHTDAPYRNWLLGMKLQMERRNGSTFSEIWSGNAEGFLKDSGLSGEAMEQLKTLGKGLGGQDRQMQIQSMGRYLKQVELEMEEMRRDIRMRMKLRVCLGVSCGILIMLILI